MAERRESLLFRGLARDDGRDARVAAYEGFARTVMQEVAAAVRGAAPHTWLERVRTGLEACTGAMAAEPHFARTLLVEVLAAGPRALAHAIDGLVQDHIVERGAGSVREITLDLVDIAVALLAALRDAAASGPTRGGRAPCPVAQSSRNPSFNVTWKWATAPSAMWPRVSTTSNHSR